MSRLAVAVYRFGMWFGRLTFRLALRLDREAIGRALNVDTADLMGSVAESFVELGEARRLAGMDR